MDHITDMIEAALRRIRNGEPEAAVWRLVESAGLLSEILEKKHPELVGVHMATGLGFQVVKGPGNRSLVNQIKLTVQHGPEVDDGNAASGEEG
jgi:hypothetical protein